MRQTSIVMLVICVLLALMVGSVGAAIIPHTQEWKDAYWSKEIVVVENQPLIKSTEFYKVVVPISHPFTITKVMLDKKTFKPYMVNKTITPFLYNGTLYRKTILVDKDILKSTGKFSGFIKGSVII